MTEQDVNILLEELCKQPQERSWLEFKPNKGSITNEQIGKLNIASKNFQEKEEPLKKMVLFV